MSKRFSFKTDIPGYTFLKIRQPDLPRIARVVKIVRGDYTQKEFAEKCDTTRQAIIRLEQGIQASDELIAKIIANIDPNLNRAELCGALIQAQGYILSGEYTPKDDSKRLIFIDDYRVIQTLLTERFGHNVSEEKSVSVNTEVFKLNSIKDRIVGNLIFDGKLTGYSVSAIGDAITKDFSEIPYFTGAMALQITDRQDNYTHDHLFVTIDPPLDTDSIRDILNPLFSIVYLKKPFSNGMHITLLMNKKDKFLNIVDHVRNLVVSDVITFASVDQFEILEYLIPNSVDIGQEKLYHFVKFIPQTTAENE